MRLWTCLILGLVGLSAACRSSLAQTPQVDLRKLDSGAAAKFERVVVWPSSYNEYFVKLAGLKSKGSWDEVIAIYTEMLGKPEIQRSRDLKANIFASLANAYLTRSKGADMNTYLLYVSLALAEAESTQLRNGLLEEMAAASIGLNRPDLARYWRGAKEHQGKGKISE